jgi:hypothetical protein
MPVNSEDAKEQGSKAAGNCEVLIKGDIAVLCNFVAEKKACPGKSRPLLTYEKHQVQISLFRMLLVKLFGQ